MTELATVGDWILRPKRVWTDWGLSRSHGALARYEAATGMDRAAIEWCEALLADVEEEPDDSTARSPGDTSFPANQ